MLLCDGFEVKVKILSASLEALQKIVGAALRRDSSQPSRDTPAPAAQPVEASVAVLRIKSAAAFWAVALGEGIFGARSTSLGST